MPGAQRPAASPLHTDRTRTSRLHEKTQSNDPTKYPEVRKLAGLHFISKTAEINRNTETLQAAADRRSAVPALNASGPALQGSLVKTLVLSSDSQGRQSCSSSLIINNNNVEV